MEDRNSVASSVFFTGVSLVIEKEKLRQHFESVGHVVSFTIFGPAPGKDFRYGIAGYMDEKTAEEAIRRLDGTTFGERAMRVTAARSTTLHGPLRAGPGGGGSGPADHSTFRKRPREPYPSPNSSRPPYGSGMGRGGGMRAPMARVPFSSQPQQKQEQSQQLTTDKAGRETMQFPRFYTDPILGRDGSLVLDALRGMATEEAYSAVEQLRVLALERPNEAKRLLHNNPALKSAVIMTLQHAGRIPLGSLPRAAYQSRRAAEAEAELAQPLSPQQPTPSHQPPLPTPQQTPQRPPAESPTPAKKEAKSAAKSGEARGARKRDTATESASSSAAAPSGSQTSLVPPSTPMTEAERDEVLELIQSMSEEDVERVLTMSARDFAQVPDPAQRKQLEVLQKRLLEMSQDL
ncbi:conserved hypothetical protein [Leishmania infantum JPCM5]|uniref:RNA_recognition_motif._(A.k.a._RRM_-_RBD_-_or_RNP_domain)_-_putative n=2 Tax=Leishmania infantum TaxID=5671 RepID=A0A6L0XXP6_LEIIN|nr:conserved hypothetical protein [Leishmania infantum JPCM5]CAC9525774.1 RNA_recognition_motif._(a.k.a._RRM_-_RBD_-_or_RNP_domain)_-_putative [Leishmania infantum]CAM70975.1 conserved hypothetical protein [Leishmania infantum JPCM5]SUZ44789.1 RNA_recognition_motif._(a.k.a._RRM_-_RBD_-_or_RNP_domain)_-_putative [Leishmania infantum]|eukprot:XP_001467904.1 conserved hypothetical protein [Leishmania infantum JPCM5]